MRIPSSMVFDYSFYGLWLMSITSMVFDNSFHRLILATTYKSLHY